MFKLGELRPKILSYVEGVCIGMVIAPLKNGIAKTSVADERFWELILSIFLTAKSASSLIPYKYFWRFFLG